MGHIARPIAPQLAGAHSKSRQALRAVVGNFHTGDLSERAVPVSGVAHQLRGIPVDLVEVGAIWSNPAIARAAAHGSIAIASNLWAWWILRDTELGAVNPAAADVAVSVMAGSNCSLQRAEYR